MKYARHDGLTDLLAVWSHVVEDDPNTPDRFQELLAQATATLATGDEGALETLEADFRALDDDAATTAYGGFTELYRQLRRRDASEHALEGANLLVERADMELERRGLRD